MTDWQNNLPPGCLPSDVSDKPRRRPDDDGLLSEAEHYAHWFKAARRFSGSLEEFLRWAATCRSIVKTAYLDAKGKQ